MQVTDSDAQLQLKKRARRRLVGAVAFVTFAAIVLPMVMDQAPPPPTPDVQIRIPGQEQTAFNPQALAPTAKPAAPAKAELAPPPVVAVAPAPEAPSKAADKPVDRPADRPVEKTPEKPPVATPAPVAEKPAAKPVDKAAEKQAAEKQVAEKAAAAEKAKAEAEAKRAAALLGAGKAEAAKPAAAAGQHVILIGAFANPGNVKVLQAKLNEIGVKSYTENLDSPQGAKTRVRAGPFPSKDAAEKALDKMKKIGVNGIVSAK